MSDQQRVALNEVCFLRNGAGIKQEFFGNDGAKIVRVSDFTDTSIDTSSSIRINRKYENRWREYFLNEGDVLVATVGSWSTSANSAVGKVVTVPTQATNGIQNQNTCAIIARTDIADQRYIYYALKQEDFQVFVAGAAAGSANQARLSVKNLASYLVSIFSLPEQKAIAHILGTLDDKIELNRKTNETLEAMAKALFKSWFVDFDPVRAKAEGRPTGLPGEISDLFPNSFEDSELGEIPIGWKISTLNDLIYLDSGLPYKGLLKGTGDSCLFTMGCADRMLRFKSDGVYAYPSPIPVKHLVNPGDIVICSHDLTQAREQLGSPFVVPDVFLGDTAAAATNTFIVRRNSPNTSEYLYQIFRSKGFREQMIASARGSVILHISKDSVLDYSFILPQSDPLLIAYQNATSGLIRRIQENSKSIQTLGKIRDALLPKLISGELRIPDAEKMLGRLVSDGTPHRIPSGAAGPRSGHPAPGR